MAQPVSSGLWVVGMRREVQDKPAGAQTACLHPSGLLIKHVVDGHLAGSLLMHAVCHGTISWHPGVKTFEKLSQLVHSVGPSKTAAMLRTNGSEVQLHAGSSSLALPTRRCPCLLQQPLADSHQKTQKAQLLLVRLFALDVGR